ncbi:uncharacterized protein Z520_03077 [Fonsecaea multimorphosa CBS 102226]|uniref:Uncharacterized protein n=1 Tax=Fonsecaea multimorphosa CBS 102226 TaxID=1442371 RepID=A0A0D2KDZ8_9EURO|nr:uncharacterized protein Z520_03077 [Fonsecaea multimorphosa CBS 102226]KIY01525.1 hypothetical protein Z520_03077 [Fonsecaea multimorphosa CBS 102226]
MDGTAIGPQDPCDLPCDEPKIFKQTLSNSTWAPLGPPVQYCLAQPTQKQCSLRFSMDIAILVVVLNFVKLVMMILTALVAFGRSDVPLLTMGDAVASFLEDPDSVSKGMSLLSASRIKKLGKALLQDDQASQRTVLYSGKMRQKWLKAVSMRRWAACFILYIGGLSAAAAFLGRGISAMVGSKSLSSLWSIGLGTVSGRTLIQNDAVFGSGKTALMAAVVLANIPQLILSLLYFTYNGLFTCMLLASEWNSYSVRRKGLRISSSQCKGAQRSGYRLQLPYRFSIPLAMASLLLHWLASQSIFVVNVSMFDYTGSPIVSLPGTVGHLVTCGYSPVAIIFTIILGVLLIGVLLGFGFGARFYTAMPIAGSCSLAIAAACHSTTGVPAEEAVDSEGGAGKMPTTTTTSSTSLPISQQPLMWGEIPGYYRDRDNNNVSRRSTPESMMDVSREKENSAPTEPLVTTTSSIRDRDSEANSHSDSDAEADSESTNLEAALLGPRRSQTCCSTTVAGVGAGVTTTTTPTTTEKTAAATATSTGGQRLQVDSRNGNKPDHEDEDEDDDEDSQGPHGTEDGYLLHPLAPRAHDTASSSSFGAAHRTAIPTGPSSQNGDNQRDTGTDSVRRLGSRHASSVPGGAAVGLGHCGFSASDVTDPVVGRAYA